MSNCDITLSADELHALTGYVRPGQQLMELLRQGFFRARRSHRGEVILERVHYEAVCRGPGSNEYEPELMP